MSAPAIVTNLTTIPAHKHRHPRDLGDALLHAVRAKVNEDGNVETEHDDVAVIYGDEDEIAVYLDGDDWDCNWRIQMQFRLESVTRVETIGEHSWRAVYQVVHGDAKEYRREEDGE